MLCIAQTMLSTRCPSVDLVGSIVCATHVGHLSVHHMLVFCENGSTYHQTKKPYTLCNSWASCNMHIYVLGNGNFGFKIHLYVPHIVRGALCDGLCRDIVGGSCSWTVAKECIVGLYFMTYFCLLSLNTVSEVK